MPATLPIVAFHSSTHFCVPQRFAQRFRTNFSTTSLSFALSAAEGSITLIPPTGQRGQGPFAFKPSHRRHLLGWMPTFALLTHQYFS